MKNEIAANMPSSSHNQQTRQNLIHGIILTALVLFIIALHLRFSWNRYNEAASSEAIMLAESVESAIHSEHILEMSGSEEDISNPDYITTKLSLTELVKTTNPIRFAYLMAQRDGKIIILVDSEPPDSPDYSPPGQIYEEADETLRSVFKSAKTELTGPTTDRWGTWMSVLVPIKDPASGEVIAIFGVDYLASEWYARLKERMIPDVVIVLSLLILFFVLLRLWSQNSRLKEMGKKLALNEALYRSVFDQAPTGIAIVNDKSFVSRSEYINLNINTMFERIIGWKSSELMKIEWTEITHPDDLAADLEKFDQFMAGMIDSYSLEKRFLRPDGSSVWTNMKISHLLGGPEMQPLHLCLLEDISMRKAAEESLRESERSKAVLLSHLPGMAYRCNYDRDWTMQFVSEGCAELTGYPPESFINNRDLSFNDIITPEYRDLLFKEWVRILSERLPFKYEYEIMTLGKKRKWVLELAEGIFNEQGEVEALEGIIIDISDRKEIENTLRYNNDHNRWTNLYNRNYMEKTLANDAIMHTENNKALMCVNLSAIHSLTTAYGFNYTQELIKKISNSLKKFCTDKRTLFHAHENRFVFFIKDYKDKDELLEFSNAIIRTLDFFLSPERVGAGIGIVEIDKDSKLSADQLLKKLLISSEKALNTQEEDFNVYIYDAETEKEIVREQNIKRELAAIADNETNGGLYLQYQPILDLTSNRISGFEALARLKSEKLGSVSPLEFIPIAEKTKLIIPIGNKIILQAFGFINRLKEAGHGDINVSINISAIQLLANDFTEDLFKMIDEMNVSPANIGIEITESVFSSDYGEINSILGNLKAKGIRIGIDDFGTGYSSLAREQELNVDCLKIDKFFIDKLLEVDSEKAITAEIISIAHKMGHFVIAEGVEHEEQKEYLLKNGCEKIQGYLIARPLDQDDAIKQLF
ncbi:MAG: EAL domain-containing protein [Synergistota bacterium]|nr:EAL domain-containing protein [Synergistota bacterium]